MEFVPLGALFASVQNHDDMAAGESFYLAEVRRIKAPAAVLRAQEGAFAVIDEPFRGTNVHDAAEATMAIIDRVAKRSGALIFIASHLGELTATLAGDGSVRLLHFAAQVGDGPPRFDYRLRDGASLQRLGMKLLEQEGVLELLTPGRIVADSPGS
jgi:DNA mismatch repair ATPase MutS